MRSARLYILTFLLATFSVVGCGTEGGVGGGVIGFDPIANTPSVVSFVISPKTVTRNATQTVQFSLPAKLSDGSTADATSQATFTSSNPNFVTVSGTGLATAVLPGTATITATIGGLTDTATFTVNPFVNRLFVSNFNTNSTTVYDPAVGGDQAPLRTIAGNLTTLDVPNKLAVSGQELFIANVGGNSTTVFSLHANGNVAPLRTIKGDNTTLDSPSGIAVVNGELFVANFNSNSIAVFPANSAGNVTPIRIISGANTLLAFPGEFSVRNGEILVPNVFLGQVLGFPVAANGNVAPTLRNLTGGATNLAQPRAVLATANEIFVADASEILAFATNANGNTAPLRTITGTGPLSGGLAVLASELFVANFSTNSTLVFPTNQNSGAAPTRQIVGPSTLLNGPSSVLIAPSI